MKFKGKSADELLTIEQAQKLPEYAGLLNDDTILIDIDDTETSDIMFRIVEEKELRCRVYKTSRGKHFLFKNANRFIEKNKTGAVLGCGLKSDIKLGCRTSYSILKFENENREIIYDILNDEEYDEIPKWMMPINRKINFQKLEEGDGRNQELFNYILTLQSNDFSKDEAIETIQIINKYVLKSPLPDNELSVILRDEAFQKPIFYKGKVFLFDRFATFMKNEHHIIRIGDLLHMYRNGIYVRGDLEIEAEMIKHIPALNGAKRSEVINYLEILIRDDTQPSSADNIAFKNGIYNIELDTLEEFTPSKVITNKINWDYNPKAYSKTIDRTLDKLSCKDKKIRMLLEEVVGYTFYRRNELRKAFFLKGEKRNGKSTFLDMLNVLLGDVNTCSLDIKELNDRFKPSMLTNKLLCAGDDIEDEYIRNTAILKKVISGDPITVEEKGSHPYVLKSYAKLLFSGNSIPRMGKGRDNEALLDRFIIVPLNAIFSKDDPDFDPYIKYKLRTQESMEYLIKIGIEGLKRVLKNNGFTESEKVQVELKEYEEVNNPMLSFFMEVEDGNIKLENEPTKRCYKRYQEFCLENNFNAVSHIEFSKQVKKRFGYVIEPRKLNGKNYRVFLKKGAENEKR